MPHIGLQSSKRWQCLSPQSNQSWQSMAVVLSKEIQSASAPCDLGGSLTNEYAGSPMKKIWVCWLLSFFLKLNGSYPELLLFCVNLWHPLFVDKYPLNQHMSLHKIFECLPFAFQLSNRDNHKSQHYGQPSKWTG